MPAHPRSAPFLCAVFCLAALALPRTAFAQEASSVEQRLQALEAEIRSLRAENEQLRRDLGGTPSATATLVRPGGKETTLSLSGLVQAQAEFGDRGDTRGHSHDRFRLRRVRLGVSGRFAEDFDFKVEGEYAGSSTQLTDGFINWSHFSWANVKVGQFKPPFGFEFLFSDPRLYLVERTFGTDRLTLNRQVGAQLHGEGLNDRLNFAVGAFNGSGQNVSTNDNDQFTWVGRVSGVAWQGEWLSQPGRLQAGANAFHSRDTALNLASDFDFATNRFTGHRTGAGFDVQLNLGRFDLWAEWLNVHFEPDSASAPADFDAAAWYLQGTYFILPKKLQLAVRFDEFDPNDSRRSNETETWTLGANWLIKGDDLKLMINYNIIDVPPPLPEQQQLMLRSQVIF